MKEYDQFSVEQLCDDTYFKDWVLGRLDADDKFWQQWQAGSAARQMLASQARLLVMALHEEKATVFDAEEIEEGKKKIIDDIDHQSGKGSRINFVWLRIAASLLIVSGLGWWLVTNRFDLQTVQRPFTAADTAHQTIHLSFTWIQSIQSSKSRLSPKGINPLSSISLPALLPIS